MPWSISMTICLSLLLLPGPGFQVHAQSILKGSVVEWDNGMHMEMPLTGANVYWQDLQFATSSDAKGNFQIQLPAVLPAKLVISFVGYKSDTLMILDASFHKVRLIKSIELKPVEVASKQGAVVVSTLNPLNVEKITGKELLKAACCNLSEAFETSPTVNVSYRDAVTGAKEIQLLGLAGIYSQLLTENIPNMRGIAGIYGLNYIPGPWMESIQVTRGSGSVVNGYESTTGQLNIEFKKPQAKETPKFYLNLFGEANSNSEINTFYKHKFNEHWSSVMMLHGNYMNVNMDRNHDGFIDLPRNKQVNLYNRWQYHSGNKIESQIGLKFLADKREGGQLPGTLNSGSHPGPYLTHVDTKRAEVYGKVGIVFPEKPSRSIGNIVQATYNDMNSSFGLKNYDATQKTFYLQSIYQDILWKSNHEYKIGLTYLYSILDQRYLSNPSTLKESVPGIFAEYTYHHLDDLTLIAGVREDYHTNYGWVFTPRFHGKYNFTENFLTRFSIGKSFRIPYLYADNLSQMVSSKELVIREEIKPEKAWNYGINFTKKFMVSHKEGSITCDFYRTDFINQLVVDAYSDSARISFYNLSGPSYSNSFQLTLNYELFERFDVRAAYKLDDVKTSYAGKTEQKPLVSRNKVLVNLSYAIANEHWKFDYTVIWDGKKKLEKTYSDAGTESAQEYSPDFIVMHLQVTKVFRRFELYAGGENLLDFRQQHPIINPSNPFSNSFDATNVWGPVEGRRIYAGLRYSIGD